MPEAFKNRINRSLLGELASHLRRVDGSFPQQRFLRCATAGLQDLELKARVAHVADALATCLPADFAAACDWLEAALAPARLDDDLGALQTSSAGLAGWVVWPLTEFVARRGLAQPQRALAALHAMTQRFTAEFALRPLLRCQQALVFDRLQHWVLDPSPHVRRLVSEGTRPRLPWGEQLPALIAYPQPMLPLLRRLQDDPSDYVRRSVANHWNDIAKDHPDLVAEYVASQLPDADPQRLQLLRRAARSLVKQGHAATLRAFGAGSPLQGSARLRIAPRQAKLGTHCELQVELRSTADAPQHLVLDYAVHRVLADGSTRPKIWKGWVLQLAAGERRQLQKRHSLRPTTVRRDHPGRHRFELRANGAVVATASVELLR